MAMKIQSLSTMVTEILLETSPSRRQLNYQLGLNSCSISWVILIISMLYYMENSNSHTLPSAHTCAQSHKYTSLMHYFMPTTSDNALTLTYLW